MADRAQRFPAPGRLQATSLALRIGRGLGRGGGSARGPWLPPRPLADVAARRLAGLPFLVRARYDTLAEAAESAGDASTTTPRQRVLERALAGGAAIETIEFLARTWDELTAVQRREVAAPMGAPGGTGPLRLGGTPVRQSDPTTCGSTVLALLAAAGDPLLALWLVTGRGLSGRLPREVRALAPAERSAPVAADRLAALQRAIKRASNAGGLGPLPWPARLGTPPWGAARVARYPGAVFRGAMVDDSDGPGLAALLDRVDRALAAGVPVPVFTGGDLASGAATAVPRHVVLLTTAEPTAVVAPAAAVGPSAVVGPRAVAPYTVFEPSGGAVHRLTRSELLAPGRPRAALGGWSHVCWVVLPGA